MNPAVLSSQQTYPITFMASILIWILFGGLAILWLVDGRVKKEQALHAFLSCLIAWTVVEMIKAFFPTLRPFEIDGSLPLTITIPTGSAFPSGHSASAFALATSVWQHDKKLGIIFLTGALTVALGRVFSNVHSYLDIIIGGFIGIVVSVVLERMHVTSLLK